MTNTWSAEVQKMIKQKEDDLAFSEKQIEFWKEMRKGDKKVLAERQKWLKEALTWEGAK